MKSYVQVLFSTGYQSDPQRQDTRFYQIFCFLFSVFIYISAGCVSTFRTCVQVYLELYPLLEISCKILSRIWQESGKIFERFLQEHSCKILLGLFLQDLIRFLQESFKILQEYSYKIFKHLSG